MKRVIVTTTIHEPTEAIQQFIRKKGWDVIIVGDKKTPHAAYRALEKKHQNILYFSPGDQEKKYRKLSDAIGWNCIQRRSLGFIEAYRYGAKIVATVDDDNIPYDWWGERVFVGQKATIDMFQTDAALFDPLSVTKYRMLWHRGYPIELLRSRLPVKKVGRATRMVLVQADLWDGDPDVDAVARIAFTPVVKFPKFMQPFGSDKPGPFNSQNTFLAREVLPYYMMIPHIGRMDDIWASYIVQKYFPNSVIYSRASVYQDRNAQDVVKNLEDELLGYRSTYQFAMHMDTCMDFLPKRSQVAYMLYQRSFSV